MPIERRDFLRTAAGAGLLAVTPRAARAEEQAARATRAMPAPRIKDISVIECEPAGVRLTVVKITTDQDGLYGYGFGTYGYPYVPPPTYEPPTYSEPPEPYSYGSGSGRELPQLFFKDGSVYLVTDYWLVEGQIHFITVEDVGAKSVEHVIPFDDLDLQRTIDVDTRLGFKFVLRNEPVGQYLQHHPDANPPTTPPPQ